MVSRSDVRHHGRRLNVDYRGCKAVRRGPIRTNLRSQLQGNPPTVFDGANLPIPSTCFFKLNESFKANSSVGLNSARSKYVRSSCGRIGCNQHSCKSPTMDMLAPVDSGTNSAPCNTVCISPTTSSGAITYASSTDTLIRALIIGLCAVSADSQVSQICSAVAMQLITQEIASLTLFPAMLRATIISTSIRTRSLNQLLDWSTSRQCKYHDVGILILHEV
ncbi:unnamed protein product [Protopolystoma xenopodis]|uniref:Uncharacterized protein n=1 Tax=Protopolystoma xenopodis TaxID=117903 RepID=A0A3S5FGM4_9PLAT|nr:unnamed protein product [Protopolystoma xenopodis]